MNSETVLNHAFWQNCVPSLTLSANLTPSFERVTFGAEELLAASDELREDAYHITRPIIPKSIRKSLIDGIDQMVSSGLDATWALMFDEFWLMYSTVSKLISHLLGPDYCHVTGNYVFIVQNSDDATGWGVHRDLPFRRSINSDGMPEIMSCWVALTDATPLNSCLYCVPGSRDENYPLNLTDHSVRNLSDIRCLTVEAGQIIVLNHSLLHWGSRSSSRGRGRRISLVFDVQRGDVPSYHYALLDPRSDMSFEQRAAYIAHVILWLNRYNVKFSTLDLSIARTIALSFGNSIGLTRQFSDEYVTPRPEV